ncbi:MAG: AAA family ATPase [Candidatus Lokiarchaeota archaeon]|nr:AAA family ATPase [Candidatus Lokiarchaeota archaeon]
MSKQIKRVLHPKVKSIIDENDEVRIRFIQKGSFVEYEVIKVIWQEILDLLEQPVRPRMEGMLLVSPTNNGKTTMIRKFIVKYSPDIGNLVYVETPERTTLKEFYVEILNTLGYPAKSTRSTGDLRRKILVGLENQKVKMLFFDEIQNLLDSRRDHKRDILNGLKSLNNRAQIPIVLVGIETAKEILDLDKQVADRYPAIEMPLWEDGTDDYYNLLATFEALLPLKKPSNLHSVNIAKRLHAVSEGKIGRITTIIRKCGIKAIRGGEERITLSLLKSMPFRW